jgi:5-methylcytosine-specific restriction protein A
MVFERGNKALRDHLQNGEMVFLFKDRSDGQVETLGEMAVRSWRYEGRKDPTGKIRRGVVFELVRRGFFRSEGCSLYA